MKKVILWFILIYLIIEFVRGFDGSGVNKIKDAYDNRSEYTENIDEYDIDGDGELSVKEFNKLLKKIND